VSFVANGRKEKYVVFFFSQGKYLGHFNQCPAGGKFGAFFLVNALQGEYLGFFNQCPPGKIFGKNGPTI
jgi:hypothetical protein